MSNRPCGPAAIPGTGARCGLGRGIALELAVQGCSGAINHADNTAVTAETAKLRQQAARGLRQQFVPIPA